METKEAEEAKKNEEANEVRRGEEKAEREEEAKEEPKEEAKEEEKEEAKEEVKDTLEARQLTLKELGVCQFRPYENQPVISESCPVAFKQLTLEDVLRTSQLVAPDQSTNLG